MELTSASTQETQKIASNLAQKILAQTSPETSVIALEGELGAGKTTFTQGFVKALGINEGVRSPTFLLMKQYQLGDRHVYHIDCYRINDPKELEPLEIGNILKEPKAIVLIEWPERIASILPENRTTVHIDHVDESTRKITITP